MSSLEQMDEPTRQFRDALRLLFILTHASDPIALPPPLPGAVFVVPSQKRLQKMDFWVRNPDHLAHSLLDMYESDGDVKWLRSARSILDSDEPEIRRDSMAKYIYGAYEPIDTGLAPLISYGLAQTQRHPETRRRRYFLLEKGLEVAMRIATELAEAHWYVDRTKLIGDLCRGRTGEELARMQYALPEYANAPNGETIASIARQVRDRLARMEGR